MLKFKMFDNCLTAIIKKGATSLYLLDYQRSERGA